MTGLFVILSRIGIRSRVFGGFALILGFLVLLSVFALQQVGAIGGTVDDLVVSADGDVGMAQVRTALMATDTTVERFIRTRNRDDQDAVKKAIGKVGEILGGIEAKFGALPIIASGKAALRDQLTAYRTTFDSVAATVDRLRAAVDKTEAIGSAASLQAAGIALAAL